jgi:hypothetical protein
MVQLSPLEFETLGHMSVKKGTSRHQLLRNALDEYMALLATTASASIRAAPVTCPR